MLKIILTGAVWLLFPLVALAVADLTISPTASSRPLDLIITKSRVDWRTYEFEALGGNEAMRYLWDFGDKKLGEGLSVKHTFPGSGVYKIILSVSDNAGGAGQTEESLVIGFWHLANPYVLVILGGLALGVVALILAIVFNLFPKYGDD